MRVFNLRCGDLNFGGVVAEDAEGAKERLVRAIGRTSMLGTVAAFERAYGPIHVQDVGETP